MHNVLHPVGLPVKTGEDAYGNPVFDGTIVRKEPGDTISKDEWTKAGQNDDDIAALEEQGAVELAR